MSITTYRVEGMTCGHCVASVTEELSELEDVQHVDVTLDSGDVRITSTEPPEEAKVRAAVEAAGYRLA